MLLTTDELAALLGVSTRQIQLLAKEGVAKRVRSGKYDAAVTIQRMLEHSSGKAAATDTKAELDRQRTQLAKEQAEAHRLKNQILAGDVVPRDAVEREWISIMQKVRNGVLAVTSRVRFHLPNLTAEDGQVIDRELREALTALAGDGQASG
jgi:phage terminase Nu1 subunit (DNA packaging protein)